MGLIGILIRKFLCISWLELGIGVVIAGIVTFYKDFVESLYELLGGSASVTGKELVTAYVHIQSWTFNFLMAVFLC